MSKPIIADYYDESGVKSTDTLYFTKLHGPKDQWAKSDRVMLVTSLALSALLISAGTLGILSHLGHDVWRFKAIASNINYTYCALGASAGAGLLLVTVGTASVKAYRDYKEKKTIISILEKGQDLEGKKASRPHLIPVLGSHTFTVGAIRNYHIVYSNREVHLFATKAGMTKKVRALENIKKTGFKKDSPAYEGRALSIMRDEISYSGWEKVDEFGGAFNPITKVWKEVKLRAPVGDRVVQDYFRFGFGLALFALSIAAVVTPHFYQFRMSQTVQAFGASSTTMFVAGILSGVLLRTQSDEFVKKGHDKYYRKVSYGVSYGISRTAFASLFMSLAIAGAYYKLTQTQSLNPLLIAPPLAATSLALVAYSFFKGKAHEKRWKDGCSIDMQKKYDDGNEPWDLDTESNSRQTFANGSRYVLSSHIGSKKRLVIDLADINHREAFEGAKLQYDIAATLLPLLALVCVVSLVGTSFFLRRFPLPIA